MNNDDDNKIVSPDEHDGGAPDKEPAGAPDKERSGAGGESGPPKKGGDLRARVITAAFLAVLYIVPLALSIYVHSLFYDALILFFMVAAAIEFSRAISQKFAAPILPFVIAYTALGYTAFKLVNEFYHGGGITTFFGVLAVMFIACVVYNMISNRYNINNVVSTLFVMIYPVAIMTYLLALEYMNYGSLPVLLAFIVTVLTDTMAYAVGSTVRGPKLCPKISPKKTVSGAIGGIIGGAGGAMIVYAFASRGWLGCALLPHVGEVGNILNFLFLGVGASLFCQIGDLISSYIKRAVGIKDYGKILKGHGGFMDRVDGLIVAAVFVFIYFTIFGAVAV